MNKRLMGLVSLGLVIITSSCTPPATPIYFPVPSATTTAIVIPSATATIPVMELLGTSVVPIATHAITPAQDPPAPNKVVYDVRSTGRKRAPYGDSYAINRFERPFLQDMKYEPDMDIINFSVSEDGDWYYVTIQLSGNNPNNPRGINYGVEIDKNADGYGDTLIWAQPPFSTVWDSSNVQVYNDTNHDTAGVSSEKSDPGSNGNGYDTLVFDGSISQNADPDLAWVRIQPGPEALVQFAFKQSLAGPQFLLGAVADSGLRDVTKYDYNDHIKEVDAGSPLRASKYYPLNQLFAVDNTCWEGYGMKDPVNVGKVCPASLVTGNVSQALQTPGTGANSYP